MSTRLSTERCRQGIRDHAERLAADARAAGDQAPVPTCPGWSVADLVEHVGQTLHWVSEIVEDRITDPSQLPTEEAPLPTEPDDWPAWLSAAAARATAACSDEAMDAAVFNPAGDDRSGARFWLSSLLNETVVHGADAAAAAETRYDVDADIAAELVTNHLMMLTSPGWAAQRPESADAISGSGETLHWHATDQPSLGEAGEWFIERRPDGARWHHGHDTADVTVQGPASSLLLVLTRRRPISTELNDSLDVTGEIDLLTHWVEHTAHQAE